MKYKVGDIVQFEKDCVLPAGGSIAAGSCWRVKEVEENYYELWYRDEHLPDMTERIEYKLVDDCCEKINTTPSITKRINDKSDAINGHRGRGEVFDKENRLHFARRNYEKKNMRRCCVECTKT